MIETLERLAAVGIQLLPTVEITTHYVFERDGFVCLVERRGEGFGSIGAPGLLTEHGIEMLVWRGERALFVSKGQEREADAAQVNAIRQFSVDLKSAIGHS